MDRDRILRRDFPTGRRGYDPAAVDEHLRRVADAFEANAPLPAPSLAASTSEQVREILEAAERSVAQVRSDAAREASDHVAQVQQATSGMLAQLDALESELGRLLEALRASGERLTEGLQQLQADVAGAAPPPAEAPAPPADSSSPADAAPVSALPADDAGARLIALNMALSGSSREETAAYLAEHFELTDAEGLLDDVYARAQK
ncbi:DivIVA domain-containing protein [Solirubrobacter sp. CPCC 204708]|uniref:DivIVA domain-containing protein n=1 Tax=Solirubrobacter deserti TaxID=2282478 RepID=A0ABT4RSJ7_9ACTN|nr:DivIVA domain-containing protein [Solirubrobacter deserti]MBE2316365.1 DivIVA domain-containing protein [Solirubrobacter deserti]MDA0141555.1 DivIVA domain-containing protein [Solirubrobacter deserti]